MPAPLNPNLWPTVLHDEDAVPISATNPLPVTASGPGGGVNITGLTQIQTVETTTPLAASGSTVGADHDCINYESFGVSVFVDPDNGQAINATLLVENSADGITWRTVDSVALSGAVDAVVQINRVYSVTRQFYRATITNNDMTNAMDATELVTMLKPV